MEFLRIVFGNTGEVLVKLLSGYFSFGWPFALMHALVLFSVIYHSWYKKIRIETEALKRWNPVASTDSENIKKGETTSILDQFVEDSEALGSKGFLVPMTDFSDRLDSNVDGMVSELHDRINLFLLVGIAGTLFGLFEFAFRSYEALTSASVDANERVRLLGEYLSSSMAKAFPVAFVGLVLTFIFQIIAAFPERRLRESLSEAARKALRKRKELSVSQVSVITDAAAAIQKALLPLNDLKITLTQSIQPVVKEFGTRLDQSLGLVKTQFNEIHKTTTSLKGAVESVNTGVDSLNKAADSLKTLLQNAPEVLSKTIKLQDSQLATIQNFEKVLESYLKQAQRLNLALNDTLNNLNRLPDEVIRETRAVFENLGTDSLSVWRDSSKEFYEILSHDYDGLFDEISSRVENVQGQVVSISSDLQVVTENLGNAISSLSGLPASIDAEIKTTFESIGTESKSAWVSMSNKFGGATQTAYVNYLSMIGDQAKTASEKLKEGSETFNRVAGNWEKLLKDPVDKLIKDTKADIEKELKRLDQALIERYPLISEKIADFNKSLGTMLGQVQSIQVALAQWLKDAEKAQNKVHDIHEGLVVADLLQTNIDQIKEANRLLVSIQGKMPGSKDGTQTDIAESRRLLLEIRDGIDKMGNKKGWIDRIRGR